MIPHTSRVRVAVAIQVSLINKQEHIEQAARALGVSRATLARGLSGKPEGVT